MLGRDSGIRKALRNVEDWHRWLGSREVGRPITGAAGLCFFFLLVSGTCLWWPRRLTRAAFRSSALPNLKLRGRARDWNWHNSIGLWAAPLLLVTTLTGTVLSYRWAGDLLFVLTGNEPPPRPPEYGKRAGGMGPGKGKQAVLRASLDSLWAKAESRVPAWSSISLRFPQKPGGPFIASITEPGFFRRHARSQLTLDAATAGIVKWEPYLEQNPGRRLRSWVVPLHTGRAGGPAGQFLAFLAAGAAALLVWTGASMGLRRLFNARKKPESPFRQPIPSTVGGAMVPAALSVHSRERFRA